MASATCRQVAVPRARHSSPQPITAPKFPAGEVAETLLDLVALGFVQPFKDQYGITRYRATQEGRKQIEENDGYVA